MADESRLCSYKGGLNVANKPDVLLSYCSPPTSSFISLLSSLPHLRVGGGGVWPLPGGECDEQPGLLPQRCPGAAPSAAFQGQHGGDGHS